VANNALGEAEAASDSHELYDPDSNRTEIKEAAAGCSGTFTTTASYTYDPATTPGLDELTSITTGSGTTSYDYTNDGQTSSEGTNTLAWDGSGRTTGGSFNGTAVNYTYAPDGNLESRTTTSPAKTTNYLLGDQFESDAAGTVATSYLDGPAGDLASFAGPPDATSTVSYLYYSGHGDLAAEADSGGTLTADHNYGPFGGPGDTPSTNSTSHRYTGAWNKQYDSTSTLILMGARPYDPTTGRFLATDPIDGGSLNNYDYAGQDPINGYDLSGLKKCNVFQSVVLPVICALKSLWSRSPDLSLPDIKVTTNAHGEPTSGPYTILESRQTLHKNGTPGKSQFGDPAQADQMVIAAAIYADQHRLWRNNRATLLFPERHWR
jgi:RHS repeat-associated protein